MDGGQQPALCLRGQQGGGVTLTAAVPCTNTVLAAVGTVGALGSCFVRPGPWGNPRQLRSPPPPPQVGGGGGGGQKRGKGFFVAAVRKGSKPSGKERFFVIMDVGAAKRARAHSKDLTLVGPYADLTGRGSSFRCRPFNILAQPTSAPG